MGGGRNVSKRKSTQEILLLVYYFYPLSFFWIVLYLYKFWRYLGYDFTITFYLCFPATLCLFSPWFVYLGVHESCYGWCYGSLVKGKLRSRKDTFRPFFFDVQSDKNRFLKFSKFRKPKEFRLISLMRLLVASDLELE